MKFVHLILSQRLSSLFKLSTDPFLASFRSGCIHNVYF